MNRNPVSDCCQKPLKVISSDEGTSYYECTACHMPAGMYSGDKVEVNKPISKEEYKWDGVCGCICHCGMEACPFPSRHMDDCEHCNPQFINDSCHCHLGGNYKDCKSHPVLSCEHCVNEDAICTEHGRKGCFHKFVNEDTEHWDNYEVQRSYGSWTTVGQLLADQKQRILQSEVIGQDSVDTGLLPKQGETVAMIQNQLKRVLRARLRKVVQDA